MQGRAKKTMRVLNGSVGFSAKRVPVDRFLGGGTVEERGPHNVRSEIRPAIAVARDAR